MTYEPLVRMADRPDTSRDEILPSNLNGRRDQPGVIQADSTAIRRRGSASEAEIAAADLLRPEVVHRQHQRVTS